MTVKTDEKQGFFVEDNQVDALQNSYAYLHGIIQQLNQVVHPDIIAQLQKVKESIHTTFKPYWDAEAVASDNEYKALSNLASENNLHSIWSMSSVKSSQMNEICSLKIKKITYESWGATQTRDIKGKLTWLEVWKVADEMMRASGDGHHVFIEGFDDLGKGHFRMYAGS